MNNPFLVLPGEVEVTVEMIQDYANDEMFEIHLFNEDTSDEVGCTLNNAEVEALIGFLKGAY